MEQISEFLKNLLEQDKIYLQSEYSVSDFLNFLKYIRKAKINNVWHTGEITKATQTLFLVRDSYYLIYGRLESTHLHFEYH